MATLQETITEQFYAWEIRGRGWSAWPYAVELEPPFRPFYGFVLPRSRDDGRRPTLLSRLADGLFGRSEPPEETISLPEEEDPAPWRSGEPLVELLLAVPPGMSIGQSAAERLLLALRSCQRPFSFEVIGHGGELMIQIACRQSDAALVESHLRAFFPDVAVTPEADRLERVWESGGDYQAIADFGLSREFMLPLERHKSFDPDPLLPLLAILATLREGEVGVLQLLVEPAREPWAESVLRAVFDNEDKPFFKDAPEISSLARQKVGKPLYATVLRLGARAKEGRASEILWTLAGVLMQFGTPAGNELLPLSVLEDIDPADDLLSRESHRSGMLLSSEELVSFLHLPSASVKLPGLRRTALRTKAAPARTRASGVVLGENVHRSEPVEVAWPAEARMRHAHIIGASGSGKSTLLVQLITQDIEAGAGLAVLDPHGDLIDAILARIPEDRLGDVILFDPSDEHSLVGWNILAARSEVEKILLSSDLVGLFRRLSTSWGDQMTAVLANAILAFLERPEGGTLLDLRQFLVDKQFREAVLATVTDPEIRFYWTREFPLLVGKPQGSILTRLDTLLRSKLVRRIVGSRDDRLDLRHVIDRGEIFLGKLSQGAIGEENAAILGSLLVSKFHQVALSRQDTAPEDRRPFTLYIDEAQHFATASMAGLLSGARKYGLALVAAHQELNQFKSREPEVLSALLSNAETRIAFRVAEDDARHLEKGFSFFGASDLANLAVGEAICRIGRSEDDFNLRTLPPPKIDPAEARERRGEIVQLTRQRFPIPEEPQGAAPEATVPPPRPPEEPPHAPREEAIVRARPPRPAASPPPPLGRGGAEHKYLQELVKRWGEERGFRAVIEQPVEGGSVDVALAREGVSIACEISVSTGVEHEAANVEKCLRGGFTRVACLSMKRTHLARLEAALGERLAKDEAARVAFLLPEEFPAFLDLQAVGERETMVGGYKVKVKYRSPAGGEAGVGAKAVAQVVARSLKRLQAK
ncbi:MAG TPA: type IV secretion system DNA-binding domain-containing protein [Thermoanaerobaculia bacterium]|jgi:hypothetical protein|nr:type IV secretion system DNA-binding domain-containing protein [Thermoanaerobaculia bacterium]